MIKLSLLNLLEQNYEQDFDVTEEYPVGFDINEFKNIRSYKGKLNFARQYLGNPIGQGTARIVYRVDKDKVLKLAKNRKGIAQNEVESRWLGDSYYYDILAQVLDVESENYLWIEMEVAYRPKQSDFKRLWGVSLNDCSLYLRNKHYENHGYTWPYSIDNDLKEQLDENENVQKLISFMYDSGSPAGDLTRTSSWGIVQRNGDNNLVLIDFGLDEDVYNTYYGRT